MRKRWLAGLAGASILVFGAVNLLQKVKGRDRPTLALQDRGTAKVKQWRSPTDPQTKADPSSLLPPANDLTSTPPPGIGDDPVGTVETFLQRNRKEADDSIRALTQEAEMLRARLQKVEDALGRWQAIAGALNQEPKKPSQAEPAPKAERSNESTLMVGPPPATSPAEIKPPALPPEPPSLPADPAPAEPPQKLPPAAESPPTLPGIPPPG